MGFESQDLCEYQSSDMELLWFGFAGLTDYSSSFLLTRPAEQRNAL